MYFVSTMASSKTPIFCQEGGCNKLFFYELVFSKMSKVIVFLGAIFWQILVDVQEHYRNRYFSRFLKAKKKQNNDHF